MSSRVLSNLVLTGIVAAMVIAGVSAYNRAWSPDRRVLPPEDKTDPDYAGVLASVTPASIESTLEHMQRFGSRFGGQQGVHATGDWLADELSDAGFNIIRQPVELTVPVTEYAELRTPPTSDGEPGEVLSGVTVYPLLPNLFRTASTPPEGVVGEVFLGELGLAREFAGETIEGGIVLLPAGSSWTTVAGMGAAAVLYYLPEGQAPPGPQWDHHLDASLSIPRFYVSGDAESLVGKRVHLRSRVTFQRQQVDNVIGVLPGSDPQGEAVVLMTHYDAYSYAPDRAIGASSSAGLVAAVEAARWLGGQSEAFTRTVVVVFTPGHGHGLTGARQFAYALGHRDRRAQRLATLHERAESFQTELDALESAMEVANDPAYWAIHDAEDPEQIAAEEAYWEARSPEQRQAFAELVASTLDLALVEGVREVDARRLAWVRAGLPVPTGDEVSADVPTWHAYDGARLASGRLTALKSKQLLDIKDDVRQPLSADNPRSLLPPPTLPRRTVAHGRDLADRMRQRIRLVRGDVEVAERFAEIERFMTMGLDLSWGPESAGLIAGSKALAREVQPGDIELIARVEAAAAAFEAMDQGTSYLRRETGDPLFPNLARRTGRSDVQAVSYLGGVHETSVGSIAMLQLGHLGMTFASLEDNREFAGTPNDTFDRLFEDEGDRVEAIDHLTRQTRVFAGALDAFARGAGSVPVLSYAGDEHHIDGRSLTQLGDSLVPTHPLGNTIVRFDAGGAKRRAAGVGGQMWAMSEPDGEFSLPYYWTDMLASNPWTPTVSLDLGRANPETGEVEWVLLESASGVGMPFAVKEIPLDQFDRTVATAVMFRATAVQLFPMPDPNTLKPYTSLGFLEKRSMSAPESRKVERVDNGPLVCFVPADSELYFTFLKGDPDRPGQETVRAFALNAIGGPEGDSELIPENAPEIFGAGYLAADWPRISNIEIDAAVSMAQVNNRRLEMQAERGLADELLIDFAGKATEMAKQAELHLAQDRVIDAKHAAWESLAYSSNVHPVIRRNARDAIMGIVFFLFLTIPAVVCIEKLLIGSPDIRYQIAWLGVIFMVLFLLLRFLHPAYELVRSSYVILLGFVTVAMSLIVLLFVVGKFATNVKELYRKALQDVEASDVSRVGAASTAVALGLNNLRKRPVRTTLTLATLVLITFVMISFTSVRSDIVDREFTVGGARYTGLLIRDRALADVRPSLSALREIYGERYTVIPRGWAAKLQVAPNEQPELAEYEFEHESEKGGRTYSAVLHGLIGVMPEEGEVLGLNDPQLLTVRREEHGGWFDDPAERIVYLSEDTAARLHIRPEMVRSGGATVTLGQRSYEVAGLFDANRLESVLDLDGEPLIPPDIRLMARVAVGSAGAQAGDETEVPEDVDRLLGDHVAILPFKAPPGRLHVASIAVALPEEMRYADAKQVIQSHLEQSGEPAYYGLEDVAYYGGRLRAGTLEGAADMILPIIIAALTVLNTMYGSVYERRSELYVFNAVGLAPNHIKWLFFAEASVFAIVGVVGGYLMAQLVGAGIRWLAPEGGLGLSINYSSLMTILVSVVIMVVVILSAMLPARMASQLAAPSKTLARRRVGAEGDVLELELPFTFSARDRIAIMPYFIDWFDRFGEGSSGEFFCSPPKAMVRKGDDGEPEPVVETTTWLKPYDLGVSQRVELVAHYEPRTRDHVARVVMHRVSGDHESWERCCHAFIGMLRKRLLTWRGVRDEDRKMLFERAQRLLDPNREAEGAA